MYPEWLKEAYKKAKTDDEKIDLLVSYVSYSTLDNFISACMDENGKPKAPDRGALMKARSMLPANYKNTLINR